MDLKHKLERQKELIEMEIMAETDSDAYEEDNEAEANCRINKKRPLLVISQTGDFNNVQEAAGMPTD
jgi:hypothetical protein